jgi:hypothetical protein
MYIIIRFKAKNVFGKDYVSFVGGFFSFFITWFRKVMVVVLSFIYDIRHAIWGGGGGWL